MPRVSPIQESFSAGEIGEKLRGRTTSPAYQSGLKRARNWVPQIQGPIKLREGSKWIAEVDDDNWVDDDPAISGIRVFTFPFGIDNDILVEVGESNITLKNSMDGTVIVGGVSDELIVDNLYAGQFANFIIAVTQNIYLTEPSVSSVLLGPFNKGTEDAYWRMSLLIDDSPEGAKGAALRNVPSITIPAGAETNLAELKVRWRTNFSANQLTLLGDLPLDDVVVRVEVASLPGKQIPGDVFTTDITIAVNNEFSDHTFNFIPGGGNNTLWLTVGIAYIGPLTIPDLSPIFRTFTTIVDIMFDVGVSSFKIPLAGGSGSDATFASPYTSDQLECLQFCVDPGEKMAYLTHPEVETQRLRNALGEWTLEDLSAVIDPDPFVAPVGNVWVSGNFPAACALHEGRLVLAATLNEPATVWGSRSGNYADFDASAPNSKDDPYEFPLSSAGRIQTLTSRKELVINTDISEVIGTSDLGVIAFDDFSFPKQTDWGSNCVQPLVVGREMMYTSNSRKKIRTFADEGGTNFGWDGKEISLLVEEFFNSPVRRVVYLDEPSYQACFLLTDGSLAMATYYYPESVIGFWKLITANNGSVTQPINKIMDITSINTSLGNKLVMIVNRVGFVNTANVAYEVLAFNSGLIATLDACKLTGVDEVTGIATGLDHLDDQTVNVVVERQDPVAPFGIGYTVHPSVLITAGDSEPLEEWAFGSSAYFGHFFENDIQLLSLEGVSNRGTSQVSKRRWNKVFLRLNNSAIPLVEGQFPKDRTPSSPMGVGEPFITGDVDVVDLGSGEGDLFITQDKPLRTEITAIFGKVTSTEV